MKRLLPGVFGVLAIVTAVSLGTYALNRLADHVKVQEQYIRSQPSTMAESLAVHAKYSDAEVEQLELMHAMLAVKVNQLEARVLQLEQRVR